MMRSFLFAFAAIALCAAPAAAQDHRVFANINYGSGIQKQDIKQTATFPLYGETATWEAAHAIEGGPFFDIGAGVRVYGNLFVGAAYTQRSAHSRDVNVTASVPSPIFTDTFRAATGSAAGLSHKEKAIHLQALWHVPVTVEFAVTVFGGPTFFTVDDQLISGISFAEAANFSSVSVTDIRLETQSNSSVGFNVGLDAQYMFMKNVGVGGMVRYSKGSVDLTAPADTGSDTFKIDAGGLEIAAGLRFRF